MNSDATFKMTYLGYPLLLTGTTDMRKAFHPYGLSICLNEKAEDYGFTFEAIQKAVNDLSLMQQFGNFYKLFY